MLMTMVVVVMMIVVIVVGGRIPAHCAIHQMIQQWWYDDGDNGDSGDDSV